MPDAATPDIVPQQTPTPDAKITRAQVLEGAQTKKIGDETSLPQDIRDARAKKELAEKARRENPEDIRTALTIIAESPSFSKDDFDKISNKLGGNSGLEAFVKYMDAARRAKTEGTTTQLALGADWDDVKSKVAEAALRSGGLADKFPELSEITDEGVRNDYVEGILANPLFQAELTKELRIILNGVEEKLPDVPQNTELDPLKERGETLERLDTKLRDSLSQGLTEQELNTDEIQELTAQLNAGVKIDTVRSRIVDLLKTKKGIGKNYNLLASYNTTSIAAQGIREEMARLQEQINNAESQPQRRNQDTINGLRTRQTALGIQAGELDERSRRARTATGIEDDNEFNTQLNSYFEITSITEEGSTVSRTLSEISENQTLIKENNASINAIEGTPDTKNGGQQEKDKAVLKEKFDRTVEISLARFLDKAYADANSDNTIALSAALKEAEKKGERWKTAKLETLKRALSSRWGTFDEDTRKWTYDRSQIAEDIQLLAREAANGNNASRELVAKIAGFSLDELTEKNTIAAEKFGEDRTYESLTETEREQADAEYNTRKGDFDKIFEKHGIKFTQRLFTDFFKARDIRDKTIFGKPLGELSLTKDEWQALGEHFKNSIDEALKGSREAQKAMQALEAKGVVMNSKLKLLLWILLGLAGAAVLGPVGAVGVAGVAAARNR